MSICHFASLNISGNLSPFEEFEILLELAQLGAFWIFIKTKPKPNCPMFGYTVTCLVSKAFAEAWEFILVSDKS